ncbi:hypothetical protein [Streptococcus pyogenes]|nr:hypothetical protein [Streptococcus pyogenes]
MIEGERGEGRRKASGRREEGGEKQEKKEGFLIASVIVQPL